MNAATVLDKEINQYLTLLSDRQKEAVLTVVKAFAEAATADYDETFKKELDSRFEAYKNGGNLISETIANERIRQIIAGK